MSIRKNLLAATLVAAIGPAALAAGEGAAPPAAPPAQASGAAASRTSFYYWLHPKLGMVKVDRVTNAMLTGSRSQPARRD